MFPEVSAATPSGSSNLPSAVPNEPHFLTKQACVGNGPPPEATCDVPVGQEPDDN